MHFPLVEILNELIDNEQENQATFNISISAIYRYIYSVDTEYHLCQVVEKNNKIKNKLKGNNV